ncbi:MAG: Uma2 family endonuclease [Symploca sp. SIO3C6]|uniref:Uma2 family endonuclease n=1 Tax=Symploca sp. SIO1C4 TaxID=2607765 RepID=A0A6B3NME5_9CYAN|nr:Uma2 family endonuclease [Symploca sp. SIO3C6]NER30388.1 Uma2 family endonuclease [Symploca sp. SIO1C4]
MVATPQPQYFSPEEYLEWEEKQQLKYEYIDGEVFAMTGGTIAHGTIALNLASTLKNHLRGSSCRAFIFDVKVGISQKGPFHYPDIMVSCDQRDQDALKIIYHPCLIAEVLSPSTEGFDRGRKFANYRRIETLQEYLLIDTQQMNVECFRRIPQDKWELTAYTEEEEIQLTSINLKFLISLLYEDVQFPPEAPKNELIDS